MSSGSRSVLPSRSERQAVFDETFATDYDVEIKRARRLRSDFIKQTDQAISDCALRLLTTPDRVTCVARSEEIVAFVATEAQKLGYSVSDPRQLTKQDGKVVFGVDVE